MGREGRSQITDQEEYGGGHSYERKTNMGLHTLDRQCTCAYAREKNYAQRFEASKHIH